METPLAGGLVNRLRGIHHPAKKMTIPGKGWVLTVIGWMHSGLQHKIIPNRLYFARITSVLYTYGPEEKCTGVGG